ncbi:MAG TPA: hypothetical protein VJL89_05800 [Thermodesulfovibrionia bacterium]|nr:hypothetical protein [Thermodesulfovibrionia bacterium]
MMRFISVMTMLWLVLTLVPAQTQPPPTPQVPVEEAQAPLPEETDLGVPLVFWNRTITVFRAPLFGLKPEQRVATVIQRLEALPLSGKWKIDVITFGDS